ncbi:discoidin domain-containing protein [Pedobacter jeongneungensis]|uniref:discoidin domain-containing protein n=1 Tax=Pedobacter jeongneungensis TaxID=947309 RepID=UPI000469D400|nr:discoidin domain-containing protein [Pedobacter jeongneungensis]
MKKTTTLLTLLCAALLFASSCKKAVIAPEGGETTGPKKTATTSSIITQTRNLAIVYFIPSDLDTLPNWKKRLSDVMLYAQNWYGTAMNNAGYGFKTFGLKQDGTTGNAEIVLIRAANPKASYGTNGSAYTTEIDAYFASHPGLKTSNHVLILVPAFGYDNNSTEGPQPLEGVQPFYGYGRYCFANDNPYMNMALKGVLNTGRNNFAKWVGGMMHELGHAFNAPHDRQWVSQNIYANGTNTNYKMPMMWLSNYYLEVRPSFLTDAEAAIFNACEAFNNDSKSYYGAITSAVKRIYASYDAGLGAIVVSGKYTSSGTVNKVLYYNDPNENNEGTGTNKDYNAITWASSPIGTDSFRVVMPIAELENKTNGIPYELKVKLVHDNGIINETVYAYTFQNGIPVLDFSTKTELSKTGWSVAGFSSQETGEDGKAINVIDGSTSTFWHSRWSSNAASYPHYLTIDLGSAKTVNGGLSLTQRAGASRAIKDFELLISSDGTNFTSVFSKQAANNSATQYFGFGSPKTFRYFKVIANNAWDGTQYAALSELGLY